MRNIHKDAYLTLYNPSVGTEELGHLEMIGAIIHQLTRNLKDSQIQGGLVTTQSRDPRTAIGYTSNNIVWMLVVDGRHGTLGMTYSEMAHIFKGLGCVAAVNLDGGGSSEMLVRNPWTELIEICNWPSDPTNGAGGEERPRLNAWAVVKK